MSTRTFTAQQARQALLEAGRNLLAEQGTAGGVGSITLASAIARSGVPRASAYRVFGPLEPQQEFQNHLLVEVTSAGPGIDISVLNRVLIKLSETVDPNATNQELTHHLAEVIRTSSQAIARERFADSQTGAFLSALASTIDSDPTPELRAALRSAELSTVDVLTDFIRVALDIFGLQMREGLSYLDLSAAVTSAISGTILTTRVRQTEKIQLLSTPASEAQEWTQLGLTLLGIVAMSTMSDSRRVASAEPSSWFLSSADS